MVVKHGHMDENEADIMIKNMGAPLFHMQIPNCVGFDNCMEDGSQ